MAHVPKELIDSERGEIHRTVEPRDAATLIVLDRTQLEPKVLLGRRHARHVFMPGKFVFPGGRVDPSDSAVPVARPLDRHTSTQLAREAAGSPAVVPQAIALAAIRETFEETGLVVGAGRSDLPRVLAGPWAKFVETGFYPDLSALHFIARAITPPGFPRRFDARFLAAEIGSIAHRVENVVNPDAELVELTWLPVTAARRLDLPLITGIVLQELETRLAAGFARNLPVPLYRMREDEFTRELL